MAKYVIEDTTLTNTANAIREKTGKIDTITPSNFATEIASIETGGSSTVTKGIVINEWDSDGYATDISIVGITEIPDNYLRCSSAIPSNLLGISNIIRLSEETTKIGKGAFQDNLVKQVTVPNTVTKILGYAFYGTNIRELILPSGIGILPERICQNCYELQSVEIRGNITSIGNSAFYYATALEKLLLPNITTVPTLNNSIVFASTKIEKQTGYIYVPDTLVDSFKSATNWSTYADQIKPISELEVA